MNRVKINEAMINKLRKDMDLNKKMIAAEKLFKPATPTKIIPYTKTVSPDAFVDKWLND